MAKAQEKLSFEERQARAERNRELIRSGRAIFDERGRVIGEKPADEVDAPELKAVSIVAALPSPPLPAATPAPRPAPPAPVVAQPPRQEQPGSQQRGGYYPQTNEIADRVMRTLDAYSQSVLTQLLRLSWGFQETTCLVGLPKLAERCGFSEDRARKSKKALVARGYIQIIAEDYTNPDNDMRGTLYRILLTPPPFSQRGGSQQQGGSRQQPNIKKEIKTDHKGELASPDSKNCPDCHGTGWKRRDGEPGNPVERCKHPSLMSG